MQNKRLLPHIIKNKPLFCKLILNIINYLLIKFTNMLYKITQVWKFALFKKSRLGK